MWQSRAWQRWAEEEEPHGLTARSWTSAGLARSGQVAEHHPPVTCQDKNTPTPRQSNTEGQQALLAGGRHTGPIKRPTMFSPEANRTEPWFTWKRTEFWLFRRTVVCLFGPTIVRTMVWRSVHICNFGLDQTEKSESLDLTRQVWKHPKCLLTVAMIFCNWLLTNIQKSLHWVGIFQVDYLLLSVESQQCEVNIWSRAWQYC